MGTILIMYFPVILKGENIETQVITITASAFGASVNGGVGEGGWGMEVLKIWQEKNTSYF